MKKDNFGNVGQYQEATGTYGQMAPSFFKSVSPTAVIATLIGGVSATPSSSPSPASDHAVIGEAGAIIAMMLAAGVISLAIIACCLLNNKGCREKYGKTKSDEETGLNAKTFASHGCSH